VTLDTSASGPWWRRGKIWIIHNNPADGDKQSEWTVYSGLEEKTQDASRDQSYAHRTCRTLQVCSALQLVKEFIVLLHETRTRLPTLDVRAKQSHDHSQVTLRLKSTGSSVSPPPRREGINPSYRLVQVRNNKRKGAGQRRGSCERSRGAGDWLSRSLAHTHTHTLCWTDWIICWRPPQRDGQVCVCVCVCVWMTSHLTDKFSSDFFKKKFFYIYI